MSEVEHRTTAAYEREHIPTAPQLLVALGMLALFLGASYIPNFPTHSPLGSARENVPSANVTSRTEQYIEQDFFEDITVSAEAVYVWDVAKQRALYKKNADAQLPLASLTKLMTALVVREVLTEGSRVEITLDAIKQEGESGFSDGESWDARALLAYTLVTSSNDGAYALAAAAGAALSEKPDPAEAFIAAMNVRAEQLGLAQTYFTNPTGLDASETQSGSYGSARDMAFLMEYISTRYPDILEKTTEPDAEIANESGAAYIATNTNQTVQAVPGLLGSKTGYTLLAGGNLVVSFDAGLDRPVVISVLGSTRDGRFEDVLALVDAAQKTILNETP